MTIEELTMVIIIGGLIYSGLVIYFLYAIYQNTLATKGFMVVMNEHLKNIRQDVNVIARDTYQKKPDSEKAKKVPKSWQELDNK